MRNKISISSTACIFAALLLLTLPLPWLLAAFLAAVFHELCHYTALRLFGAAPGKITIGTGGTIMESQALPYGKELICALAGPLGSLSLLLVGKWLPRTAVCAAFHAIYNLLPLYPLDGGRVLRCGAKLLFSPYVADTVCTCTERTCLWALGITALYASLTLNLGFFPMIAAGLLIVKQQKAKIPCKPSRLGVQ